MARPRRQAIRRTILLLVLLALPVTLNYYSPYLIIESASGGVASTPLFLWAGWAVTALVIGRIACAYACPLGAIQMVKERVAAKPLTRVRGLSIARYVIAIIWVATIAAAAVSAGGYRRVDLLYSTESGYSIEGIQQLVIYYSVIGLPLGTAAVLGRHAFCRYLCPFGVLNAAGARLGQLLRLPSLRLRAAPERCRACRACVDVCPMSLDVPGMVARGEMDASECILCGSCIDGCRSEAIRYAWSSRPAVRPRVPPRS